jgi:hypothetical protein
MTQLTEADYNIDMEVLMATLGIDPGTVQANTTTLQFLDGKAVLSYTCIRAIPTRALAVAMLRSATTTEDDTEPEPAKEPRKRTTKKTVTRDEK